MSRFVKIIAVDANCSTHLLLSTMSTTGAAIEELQIETFYCCSNHSFGDILVCFLNTRASAEAVS